MENFKIYNDDKKIKVDLPEMIFIQLLKQSYLRDKRLYEILKSKYEQLTQKNFDIKQVDLNQMR